MSEIIHLISGPRNISTALMYSFGNRKDTAVVDEPFYAHYLDKYDIHYHPGREETLKSQSTDATEVIENVVYKERTHPYCFIKNMAHHMKGFDYSFCYNVKNVFLIRDPKKLIASFSKVIKQPTAEDIGILREVALYQEIQEKGIHESIVLDSGEVLKNPEKVLSILCEKLDIPFASEMLSWPAGPRKEDGIWAPYWYGSVHHSTGWAKQKSTSTTLRDDLLPLYEEVKAGYEYLYDLAIKA